MRCGVFVVWKNNEESVGDGWVGFREIVVCIKVRGRWGVVVVLRFVGIRIGVYVVLVECFWIKCVWFRGCLFEGILIFLIMKKRLVI